MTALNAMVPTELHRQAKIAAAAKGERLQDLVAEGLRLVLERRAAAQKPDKPKR